MAVGSKKFVVLLINLFHQLFDALSMQSPLTCLALKYFFLNTHLGYPLNFIFASNGHVKGAYLCLAEVKWVKTGVPCPKRA